MAMAAPPLLLALDQGTSSSRAALFDTDGRPIASASAPLDIHYPADGWVEQSPTAIWESQRLAMSRLEQAITPEQQKAVISCGITNQRETTTLWKRSDGSPCGPALVWQDGRTADLCEQWKASGLETSWRARTGLMLDPYFSASKIRWLLDHEPAASSAAAQGDLCFGTVESWLLWQLSGGTIHATDMSNASRTLLMDLERRQWLDDACAEIGLPKQALPELRPCRGDFGVIQAGLPFAGVPIQALLGDQQAATLGQLCLLPGEGKCTYGTGAFLVVNTGTTIRQSDAGLLSTLGWTDEHGTPTYCLEGSLFNAGTVVQWLRDGLGIIRSAEEVNPLAQEVENAAGVMLVPAFTGWGTPHWDPSARGLLIGLTRDTRRGHIARAALEGIALSVASLVELAEQAMDQSLGELAVDGGAAASDPLLQAQADSTGLRVRRPKHLESTARGVALLAGLQAGVIADLKDLVANRTQNSSVFEPQQTLEQRQRWRQRWNDAVTRSLHWNG
ncbi:glycerol kinase GlpK [Synechococcus sp. WH 8016]|uniref:FGGY family carbohydrate kinase n=1 Tax=Synechococcus sp. WH 8016 TaxID=166318 RepID=UPI00022D9EF8|nr:glycerol kinase [Synechococcus sp. WH 8016]EHA60238.1 Glycerol kinase [Synechococcus sp. WH 8016]